MRLFSLIWLSIVTQTARSQSQEANKTFNNPILPGWNSDPSCTFVKELHDGIFYLITSYVSWYEGWGPKILLFTTTDPYDDASWTGPLRIENPANDIDPDIFWDNEKVYMSVAAGIYISEIDLSTGAAQEPVKVWNGTGDRNPEGPHLYMKDDYYYLLIGEGGTETNHSVTIARAKEMAGPYEGAPRNPILTAKNTDSSGPAWEIYPMGRETVLFAVKWEDGDWPVLDEVRGVMNGPLPLTNRDIPGDGHWVDEPDVVDFAPGSEIPRHFVFWRPPKTDLFRVSPEGHPNTLQISPSPVNLSATPAFSPEQDGLGFITRKQSATWFNYTVDVSIQPKVENEEAGISVFLTQVQHIDLGIVTSPACSNQSLVPRFRLQVEASGKPNITVPDTFLVPVPKAWRLDTIRLSVSAISDSKYVFGAAPASRPEEYLEIGSASALIVSGGSGPFTGKLPH
ncbi:arabinofuranosidase [Colletotrichum salicis]|uniref:Arabinofuranosidase n=1 Tax=Colletotrichum salicis TaxID=1209931 RepID=A0A135UFK3_9PEZI|nr:arabinofuranosidase [Colletotrichum salicis]